jgi:hypothetical protein
MAVPSHVLLHIGGSMSMPLAFPSSEGKLQDFALASSTTATMRYEDDGTGGSDSPSRVSEELLMTVSQLQRLQVTATTCTATSSSSSSALDLPLTIRRNLSLDSAQDLITAAGKPAMIRRWTSSPPSTNEASLRQRRYQCESVVKQLYEDRKERIMEIFQNTWVLSDPLDDDDEDAEEEEDDDDDEEEKEVGEEEQDDG